MNTPARSNHSGDNRPPQNEMSPEATAACGALVGAGLGGGSWAGAIIGAVVGYLVGEAAEKKERKNRHD